MPGGLRSFSSSTYLFRLRSKDGPARKDDVPTFVSDRKFDPDRGRERTVKPEAESDIAFHIREVQVAAPAGHLSGVVKERHIESAAGNPPKLGIEEQTMPVTKTVRRVAAQRAAASQRGKHEVWNQVVVVEGG